jgi:hypothetical protein
MFFVRYHVFRNHFWWHKFVDGLLEALIDTSYTVLVTVVRTSGVRMVCPKKILLWI